VVSITSEVIETIPCLNDPPDVNTTKKEPTMTQALDIASRYIATWNATDSAKRQALLADHWTVNARYADPLMSAEGTVELAGMIGAVHERFPGFRFSLINTPDGHGDWVRFSWGLGPDGAEPVVEGSDIVRMENGQLAEIVGFLDKVPAAV
jgi:hypothetical protein